MDYYYKQLQAELNHLKIQKSNEEKILLIIAHQLCNIASELHDYNELTKKLSVVPGYMEVHNDGIQVHYKSVEDI